MRAILPDITQLTQEPRQLTFTARTPDGISRGERRIPGGHCQYYYLAGTQTEEFHTGPAFSVYAGHLPYGFRFEGQPDDAEDMTSYFDEHAMPEFVKAVTSKLAPAR